MDITHDNVCSSMLSCFYSHLLSTGRPISSLFTVPMIPVVPQHPYWSPLQSEYMVSTVVKTSASVSACDSRRKKKEPGAVFTKVLSQVLGLTFFFAKIASLRIRFGKDIS